MAWMAVANYLTDFADQAVILPLTFVVAMVLLAAGWWRGAIIWIVTIGITLTAALLLKMSFISCGYLIPHLVMRGPSGHTAASGAVYGGLAAIVARVVHGNDVRTRRLWTWAVTILIIITIAASRLVLGVHTVPEVVAGGIVAVCGAAAFDWLAGETPPALRLRPLAISAVIVIVLLHGLRMPAEAAIQSHAYDFWPFSRCR